MEEKGVVFVLIQIEEAHTAAWPTGTITLGIPQKDFEDRLGRASTFAGEEVPPSPLFEVYVDPWHNPFANRYRAWPDKYYLFDASGKVVQKSTYGAKKAAVIDIDCVDLLYSL